MPRIEDLTEVTAPASTDVLAIVSGTTKKVTASNLTKALSAATSSAQGVMSAADKAALDALAGAGEVYTATVSADATLNIGTAKRAVILIDTSGGDVTVTLQAVSGMAGREIVLKKIADANTAIVDANASETIDGGLVFNLEMLNEHIRIMPVGGAWYVVGRG